MESENTAKEALKQRDAAKNELNRNTVMMAKTMDDFKIENDKVLKYNIEKLEKSKKEYEQKAKEVRVRSLNVFIS